MHHTHTSRPPHVRHHQGGPPPQLHPPPHPTQPVGINVAPPHVGPPPPAPPTIQQQHHVTNIPPPPLHGAPPQQITPYIPPHQRDANRLNHHAQQRINSQMHQTQTKNRSHANIIGNGLPSAVTSNATQQQQQQQQQGHTQQQQNIAPTSNTILQKHQVLQQKTTILQKPSMHQQQQSSHPQSHNSHQQLPKHPLPQPSSTLPSSISSQRQQHHPAPQPSSLSSSHQQILQQQQQQHNPQSIQPKAILSQKSNVQQKTHSNSNSQQQNTIILQKNSISQNSSQQQQKFSQNISTSSVSQHKISKSQAQQSNTTNNSNNNSSNGVNGGSSPMNSSVSNNVVSQQQSTVQSNQIIMSQQIPQTTSTNRVSANAENKSSTTTSQKQQQDKTDQNDDLICGNNQIHQILTTNETLANTKEKTPMCLVNELARFNKIQHQYRLTGEQGPAHSKRFTVTLKLGEEEYTADGPSIKKAQHSAAAEAVCKTKYTHPPVKTSRLKNGRIGAGNITPTVELNALAMKLGKPTVYVFDPTPLPPQPPSSSGPAAPGGPSSTAAPLHHHHHQQQQHHHHHHHPPPPLPSHQHPHLHHHQQQHHHNHAGNVNGATTIGVNPGTAAIPAQAQMNGGTTTKSSSATHQQNNFSMNISNHTYYQENHHYQSYPRQNSMNIYQPPPARYTGFTTRKPYSTRGGSGGGGFFKCTPHLRITTYNDGISSIAPKEMCRITLMVGKQKFVGIGDTPQAARHDAAARALEVLKPLVTSDESNDMNTSTNIDDPNADLKSPISLVHETALKRNLPVTFEVKLEKGPPHMKTFVTICKVGNFMTEGEGNGKKISKKRAAEKMLEELKKLPPLPPLSPFKSNHSNNNNNNSSNVMMHVKNIKRKPQMIKKKTKNIIKDNSEPIDNHDDINPISKLIQIQQALKEREPIYTLIEEKGAPRRREFIIEVAAGGHVARGSGPNKKMAKKFAAKNLLASMGYDCTGPNKENNSKMANGIETIINKNCCNEIVTTTMTSTTTTAATVLTTTTNHQGGSAGRQIVPGLLLMQQPIKNIEIDSTSNQQGQKSTTTNIRSSESSYSGSLMPTKGDNSINKNGLTISDNTTVKNSSSIISNSTNNNNNAVSCDGVRPKDQLLYLADLLGFQVVFSDYPKGNHGEYLTIVTLSTDPPQICHGAGSDTDASQDKAAMTALQMLSNLGLDNVKPKRPIIVDNMEEKKSLISSGVSKE